MCWSLVILSDKHISYVQISNLCDHKIVIIFLEEHSGSVIECLIRDWGVEGSSLTGGTVLCPWWARHFILCIVVVRPRHDWKTFDWEVKNQIKQTNESFHFLIQQFKHSFWVLKRTQFNICFGWEIRKLFVYLATCIMLGPDIYHSCNQYRIRLGSPRLPFKYMIADQSSL